MTLTLAGSTKPLETVCVIGHEERQDNIRAALARGLPVCTKEPAHNRKLCIVAGGPSVNDYRKELASTLSDVWAINGAYRYLLDDLQIVPNGFIGLDPQKELTDSLKALSGYSTFYIASCCHPNVFDRLEGYKVKIWHSNSDTMGALPSGSITIPGGITAVSRAPFLGYLQGYRDISIYGADCSYEDKPYAYETDGAMCDPKDQTITVKCNGATYRTETGLMHQAENLGRLQEVFAEKLTDAKLTFRCGGLLPAFLESSMERVNDSAA